MFSHSSALKRDKKKTHYEHIWNLLMSGDYFTICTNLQKDFSLPNLQWIVRKILFKVPVHLLIVQDKILS